MGKGKRGHDEVDTYAEDDFVENDDGNTPKKKTKKAAPSKGGKKSVDEKSWELSSGRNPKRLGASEFKGQTLIRIGETYEKDGEYLPGKKGISLTVDQYKALLKFIPKMNAYLESQGIKISGSADDDDEMKEEAEAKPQRKAKTKAKSKSNIEATSDEEEEEE